MSAQERFHTGVLATPATRRTRAATIDSIWWQTAMSQRPPLAEALAVRDIGYVFQCLRACGWSVTALAAATSIPENQVRSITRGEQQVRTYDVLERIAVGLRIPRGALGLAYTTADSQIDGVRELAVRARDRVA